MTGLLFTLVWFPLLGAAVSRLVGRMNWFLAGAGVNGLILFIAGVLHIPLQPVMFVMGVAALVIVVAVEDRQSCLSRQSSLSGQARLPVLHVIVLAVAILFLLAVSAITPLADYDGRAFWLLKAKAIAHESSLDILTTPRNEYPLLVPIDAATIMIAARDLDDRHVRWLYALFAIALALEVRRHANDWLGVLVLFLPQIAFGDGGALTAYSDLALAAFVACAVFELANETPDPLRIGLWLSFLVLTKNEGLPFALVLLVIAAIVFLRGAPAPSPARAAVGGGAPLIAVAFLFLWRSRIDPTDEARFSLANLRLGEAGDAIFTFARHALSFREWGVFWLAALAAAAFLAWQKKWRPLALGAAAIAPMLAIYLIMYLASDWNVKDLVNSTAPRLLMHFTGPAMLLIGHAIRTND